MLNKYSLAEPSPDRSVNGPDRGLRAPLQHRAGNQSLTGEKDAPAPKYLYQYFGLNEFFGYLCKLF